MAERFQREALVTELSEELLVLGTSLLKDDPVGALGLSDSLPLKLFFELIVDECMEFSLATLHSVAPSLAR